MSKVLFRWAALAVSTVVGAAVLTPLSGVADAAGTPTHYYVASKAGAPPALYNNKTGARVSPVGVTVRDLRASQDGTRFIDLEAYIDGNGDQVQRVVVYDISGNPLNTVTSSLSTVAEITSPALSPDGTLAVWTRHIHGGGATQMFAKNLASGAVSTLGNDLYHGLFVSPDTLIVRHFDGSGYWLPLAGGTPTQITPFPWQAVGMTVSPDGHTVAWEHELGTLPSTADIMTATLTVNASGVSLGADTTWHQIATGQDNYAPAFSHDNATVFFIHANNGDTGFGQVMSVPTSGSSAPVAVSDAALGTVITQAVGEIPPAPVVPLAQPSQLPAVLTGTSATIRFTNPGDDRVSQVRLIRTSPGLPTKTLFVPLPSTSVKDTGLVVGKTYTYTLSSIDRGGNAAPGSPSFQLVAAGAQLTYADPTSTVYTGAPFAVRFGPGSPAVLWTVDYRVNNAGSWKRWLTDVTTSIRTFTGGIPGATYQFRARATDGYSSTPLVNGGLTVLPTDQSKATLYGGTTVASKYAWLGSYRRLTTTTQYARVSLTGTRLQVIAWRCSGCGSFAIYQGSVKIGTVSTYASSTKIRQVVFTKYWSTSATRTFTIRPLATSGHPAVLIDGFAMRR